MCMLVCHEQVDEREHLSHSHLGILLCIFVYDIV